MPSQSDEFGNVLNCSFVQSSGCMEGGNACLCLGSKKTEVTGGSYTKCMKLSYYISNIIVISNNYENF